MKYDPQQASAVLERTPATLSALLGGLPEPWLRANEGPDSFSPFDVVGHLIDADETNWMTRARVIRAAGPDLRFPPFDRFRHRERNAGRSILELLEEFRALRAANLEEFREWKLSEADLELPGLHADFGRVSLKQLLATWVAHDLGHIAQVVRVMAKAYREEVGPWVAFLPILTDREVKT